MSPLQILFLTLIVVAAWALGACAGYGAGYHRGRYDKVVGGDNGNG